MGLGKGPEWGGAGRGARGASYIFLFSFLLFYEEGVASWEYPRCLISFEKCRLNYLQDLGFRVKAGVLRSASLCCGFRVIFS